MNILVWLSGLFFAQGYDDWALLQKARLMLLEEEEVEGSIDLLNTILASHKEDEPIHAEALYWKGRALYMVGYKEHAREELGEASRNYKMRSEALYFLQQSGAWERRVMKIPYQGNSWVNIEGKPSMIPSLLWTMAFDANASKFSSVEFWVDSEVFPINITVELVDWRNERWVWSGELRDGSQPLTLQIQQFRSPRGERNYLYRNILVSAESTDGRRIPISIVNFIVR